MATTTATGPLGLRGDLARDAILRECVAGHDARTLFAQVAERLRPVVPYDGACLLSTDPATLLYTDAASENVDDRLHLQFIENELFTPDFAKFRTMLRRREPVAVLSEETRGERELSARHRILLRPLGFDDELRAVFSTGDSCWGVAGFKRAEHEPDFTRAEADFVASLCEHVAHGLRTALLLHAVGDTPLDEAPGMIVLGPDDEVESISDAARHWLDELPRDRLDLPVAVHAVALRARSAAAGASEGVPRARLRTRSGRWLLLHGSQLRDASGAPTRTAIVVEPARRAEVAALMVEAYGLSAREQQVTQLLVRGLATDEIAQALWLSRHTVRDHTKAIFAKLRVSSRPELTAKLFAEQFLPQIEEHTAAP